MPISRRSTLDKTLAYTVVAATALRDLVVVTQTPFMGRLCALTLAIIPMVQNTKFQKERYLGIMEDIHHLLCMLMASATDPESIESPPMLDKLAQYSLMLQKIESCLRAQRELSIIKRLFKQSEIAVQLDNCAAELKEALDSLTMTHSVGIASATLELHVDMERRHQELLELISAQSSLPGTLSSILQNSSNASSRSFSLLPGFPKIFHGRESELQHTVNSLLAVPARVAILGPGGMGKTTLAIAALHNPRVAEKYPTRYFIPCDSALGDDSLVAIIGTHLGLDESQSSARHIFDHLSRGPPCLMILDNFETSWESVNSRAKVEELLSLLTDASHVALLITMRGAERPGKVQWTHPFLRPLAPLTSTAARQTFIEIADECCSDKEIDQLLNIADNIPLAVELVAAIVASDGARATLERWRLDKLQVLSVGNNKHSNLEMSIILSLSSPRMLSSPHAMDLLSLMSLLPDGLSDLDLGQSKPPIPEILDSKTTLIRTSLAYVDSVGRLKVLAPIREYMHGHRAPSALLVRPLRDHYNYLLELRSNPDYVVGRADLTTRIISNLGNIPNILAYGLDSDHEDLRPTIGGILLLNHLNVLMNRGLTPLMLRLPEILAELNDHKLQGEFITATFRAWQFYPLPHPQQSINEAIDHFRMTEDVSAEAQLYVTVGEYYHNMGDIAKGEDFYGRALSLASQCQSSRVYGKAFLGLAEAHLYRGNYVESIRLAREAHKIGIVKGDVWVQLSGMRHRAVCCTALGDLNHGLQMVTEAKELIVLAGEQGGMLENLFMNIEAHVYMLMGEYTEARRIDEAILHQTSFMLGPLQRGYALLNIASLDIVSGASIEMVSHNLNTALSIFRKLQHSRGISACEQSRADLELREGNGAYARKEYIRLFVNGRRTDNDIARAALEELADPMNHMHDGAEALQWAVVFLAFTVQSSARSMLALHRALRCFGTVLAQQGMDDDAFSIIGVALDGLTWMGAHHIRAECMRTMGDIHFRRGEHIQASALWKDAILLFQRSLQEKAVTEIDTRLADMERYHETNLEQPTPQRSPGQTNNKSNEI